MDLRSLASQTHDAVLRDPRYRLRLWRRAAAQQWYSDVAAKRVLDAWHKIEKTSLANGYTLTRAELQDRLERSIDTRTKAIPAWLFVLLLKIAICILIEWYFLRGDKVI